MCLRSPSQLDVLWPVVLVKTHHWHEVGDILMPSFFCVLHNPRNSKALPKGKQWVLLWGPNFSCQQGSLLKVRKWGHLSSQWQAEVLTQVDPWVVWAVHLCSLSTMGSCCLCSRNSSLLLLFTYLANSYASFSTQFKCSFFVKPFLIVPGRAS